MKKTSYFCLLLATGLVACHDSTGLNAPLATEPLAVSIQTRSPVQGESLPTVHISGGLGAVAIVVTRRGMCATRVDARINRSGQVLSVVSRVSSDPAALCAANVTVVDYQGTINVASGGSYIVRVFEAEGDNDPQLIGSAAVSVYAPYI
jgi:hypothetical protein